jgi:hypothetical protein
MKSSYHVAWERLPSTVDSDGASLWLERELGSDRMAVEPFAPLASVRSDDDFKSAPAATGITRIRWLSVNGCVNALEASRGRNAVKGQA